MINYDNFKYFKVLKRGNEKDILEIEEASWCLGYALDILIANKDILEIELIRFLGDTKGFKIFNRNQQ